MDRSAATAQRTPMTAITLLLGLAGLGLLGYLAGGWLRPAAAGAAAAPQRATGVVVLLGLAVLLAAMLLYRQSRDMRYRSAICDPLTGLYSEHYVAELLPTLMARDDRAQVSQLALIRVRIECLDALRQRHGRDAAAHVLTAVGRHIRSQTRECDVPAQPDASGFAVFLHCVELEQAQAFCRRLSTLLRNEQLEWGGEVFKVAPRTGIALRRPGEALDVLDARAREDLDRPAPTAG